jgi:hypothetical protein
MGWGKENQLDRITTQKQVETVPAKGTPYGLGNNLYLDVKGDQSRSWLFIWKVSGKNEYAGLGSASGSKGHKVPLLEARRKADQYRALVNAGKDPRQEERRQGLTLTDAVKAYVYRHKSHWRSERTPAKWLHSIEVHAAAIADRPMASLVAADIRPVVDRYWHRDCGRELRFFGDMDTLASAPPGSPRSVLARFLCKDNANEMAFEALSRTDLSRGTRTLETLRDADEHDAFLLKEFATAQRRLCIVSPWINIATMKQVGFTAAIAAARARGVEVEIYADPYLTRDRSKPGQDIFAEAHEALTGIGVKVHAVQQLHSKLVWADDVMLAVGSFNWFSAHRTGELARHETSVVYRGKHLGQEIQILEDSLKARALTHRGQTQGLLPVLS